MFGFYYIRSDTVSANFRGVPVFGFHLPHRGVSPAVGPDQILRSSGAFGNPFCQLVTPVLGFQQQSPGDREPFSPS